MPNGTTTKTKVATQTKVILAVGILLLLGLGAYGFGFAPSVKRPVRVAKPKPATTNANANAPLAEVQQAPTPGQLAITIAADTPAGQVVSSPEQIIGKFDMANYATSSVASRLVSLNFLIETTMQGAEGATTIVKGYKSAVGGDPLFSQSVYLSTTSTTRVNLYIPQNRFTPAEIPGGTMVPLVFTADTSLADAGDTLSMRLDFVDWLDGVNDRIKTLVKNLTAPTLSF